MLNKNMCNLAPVLLKTYDLLWQTRHYPQYKDTDHLLIGRVYFASKPQ